MEEGKELVVGITLNHLNAISCLLYFYERHLWNFAAPSIKRTRQITEIQLLLVKMPLLATSKMGAFTSSEIGYIEAAIRLFTTQAREKIPQSQSRDEVLASCEDLRGCLVNMLTPPNEH